MSGNYYPEKFYASFSPDDGMIFGTEQYVMVQILVFRNLLRLIDLNITLTADQNKFLDDAYYNLDNFIGKKSNLILSEPTNPIGYVTSRIYSLTVGVVILGLLDMEAHNYTVDPYIYTLSIPISIDFIPSLGAIILVGMMVMISKKRRPRM